MLLADQCQYHRAHVLADVPFGTCFKRCTSCTAIGPSHAASMCVHVVKANNVTGMPTHNIDVNASEHELHALRLPELSRGGLQSCCHALALAVESILTNDDDVNAV